jgi:hypothetical protein
MEQEKNKYNNSKIYRIVCNVTGKNYYGSTIEPTLARRLTKHRCNYKKYLEGKFVYITSFEVLQNGNYDIVLVENCNVKSKEELHRRERYYIENNDCVNKVIPTRTKDEYFEDMKKVISEKRKKHYEENCESLKAKAKMYREMADKNELLEYHKNYRQNNKDELNAKGREVIKCECGADFTRTNKQRHMKSLKHINFVNEQD